MKIITYIILLLPLLTYAHTTDDIDDLSILDPIISDNDNLNLVRSKRGGSGDILGSVKNHIVSSIGKASASVAGGSSSKGSSKGHQDEKESPHHFDVEHFDGWQLKKAILNTLFQASKAIAGGITAINGKLIKGSGYAISAGGKVVAASGDKVSDLGKKIALSAKLIPPSSKAHHFAKLSGGSSSHSNDEHDTSGHGESFTSYETPIHNSQLQYNLPDHHSNYISHSGPSGHSSGGQTYIPVSYDQSYHATSGHGNGNYQEAPSSAYGVPGNTGQHSSYDSSSNKVNDMKLTLGEIYSSSLTGPSHDLRIYPPINKDNDVHTAADALRDILKRLPSKLTHEDTYNNNNNNDHNNYIDNNDLLAEHKNQQHEDFNKYPIVVQQYEIPPDPITVPTFKKVPYTSTSQSSSSYDIPHITKYTQTITTAYGAPVTNFQKTVPIIDAQPLNIYHTMSLKLAGSNSNKNGYNSNTNNPSLYLPPYESPSTYTYPPISNEITDNSLQPSKYYNYQQLPSVKTNFYPHLIRGRDYEIQKSVAYGFPDPRNRFKRRLYKVRRQ